MASVTDAELQALADSLTADDIPSKLRCARCSRLNVQAWRLPCCENSVCASCFDDLQDACPVCSHEPVSKDVCKPHSSLRKTASVWLKTQHKKRSEANKANAPFQPDQSSEPNNFAVSAPAVPLADVALTQDASIADGSVEDTQPETDSQGLKKSTQELSDAADAPAEVAPTSAPGEPSDGNLQADKDPQEGPANEQGEDEEDEEDDDDDVVIRIDQVDQPPQENAWGQGQGQGQGGEINDSNSILPENGMSSASDGFNWQQMANMSNMMAMNGMQGFNGFPGMMGMAGMSLDPSMMGQNFFGMGMNAMNSGMGFGGWNQGMSMNGMGDGFGNGQFSGGGYMHHPGRTVHQSQYYGNSYHQNRFRGRGAHRGFGRGRFGYQGPGQGQSGPYESSRASMIESTGSSGGQDQASATEASHKLTDNESQHAISSTMDVDTGRLEKADGTLDQTRVSHQDAGADQPENSNSNAVERGVSPPGPNVPLGPAAQFAPGRGRGALRGPGKIGPGAFRGRGGMAVPTGPGLGVQGAPTGPKALRNGVSTAAHRGNGVGMARGGAEASFESRLVGRSGDTNMRKLSPSPEGDSKARSRHEHDNPAENKRSRRRGSSSESESRYRHSHRERNKDRSSRHERERSRERRKRRHRSRSPGSEAEHRHSDHPGRESRHERRRERERDRERDRDRDDDRRSHRRSRRDRSASGEFEDVATSRRSRGGDEVEHGIRKSSQNVHVSGASELDEARRAIREEKPDIDQHALEREARNRERLLKEQQRRGLAGMESSGSRKRMHDDGTADASEYLSSKHRRRARDGHHGGSGRSRRGGAYRDEQDVMDRVEQSEKVREAGRW